MTHLDLKVSYLQTSKQLALRLRKALVSFLPLFVIKHCCKALLNPLILNKFPITFNQRVVGSNPTGHTTPFIFFSTSANELARL